MSKTLSTRQVIYNLESKLNGIGRKLVRDTYDDCKDDVQCSRKRGIVPRGLIYEKSEHPDSLGVVIVGMNPGPAEKSEMRAMREDPTYEGFLRYFWDKIANRAYYVKLKELAHKLGLQGPIVWTELVKCQSIRIGRLSLATLRRDINKYLFQELKLIPEGWPIISVGSDAYRILSYSSPNRIVVGVPHVKAHGGYFYKLLRPRNKKLSAAKYKLHKAVREKQPIMISLFKKQ